MKRREFLQAAGAGAVAVLLGSSSARAQTPLRFADMHAHLFIKQGDSMRAFMERGGLLLVAEKLIPDTAFVRWSAQRQTLAAYREAKPGEVRRNFDFQVARALKRINEQGLAMVTSVESLDRVVKERVPSIALSTEGADFLEGDLAYLKQMRARGLVHVQLLHYRLAEVGDISTEEPKYNGLSDFGKEVVRECNRLGILVDCAHGSSAGIDQMLEISTRPIIYSHGYVSAGAPGPGRGAMAARPIYAPLARKLADKGGVLGLWPPWNSYANLDLYSDELIRMVNAYGADHVGIGTDMDGIGRSTLPSYVEFAELPQYLSKRGLNDTGIEAVLGGNYIRVLRQALSV